MTKMEQNLDNITSPQHDAKGRQLGEVAEVLAYSVAAIAPNCG